MPEPRPAPFSIKTLCPSLTSARTPPGTSPTRCSRFLISRGTPIFMVASPGSNLHQLEVAGKLLRIVRRGKAVHDLKNFAAAVADEEERHAARGHHSPVVEKRVRSELG